MAGERTSYVIGWKRKDRDPIPDFNHAPQMCRFTTPEGEPLFTVVTHGGGPSEGIFTLIAEAPRLRDELDGC